MSDNTIDGNDGLSMLAGYKIVPRGSYEIKPLAEVERLYIEAVIVMCDGNIPQASKLLEISPSTLYRKKSRWERESQHI